MDRKSRADEGPVHSPTGRRHAMKQKGGQTRNTTEETRNKTSKEQQHWSH